MPIIKSKIQWILFFHCFCFMILIASASLAQDMPIQGVVRDKADGQPMAKVIIRFLNPQNGTVFECNSNKKGEYMRAGLPSGFYQIKVEVEKYYPYLGEVWILGGQRTVYDIEMVKIPEKVEEDEFFANGMEHFQAKRFAEAAASFRESLKKYPESVEVNFNYAISLIGAGSIVEAEPVLKKVLELKADMPGINMALGNLYAKKGDGVQALAYFEKALQQEPQNKIIPYYAGVEYFKLGQTEKALSSFEQVIAMDAGFGAAYYQAGVTASGLGNYDKAVSYFQKFLELEPQSPEAPQVRKMIADLQKIKRTLGSSRPLEGMRFRSSSTIRRTSGFRLAFLTLPRWALA